ncbi:LpqB family beta-propeller domain-containing protein [Streptomyces gobiensis]|uniref:LpqB family beta-propeller domain-containing protein n=1 Tax=Streptomyces gobiensis TaxID=2875706 RepID=UPI001E2C8D4A|nr:LpqB family beta-propeller domain-containing protein [Streptomyces gobiensis]UGY91741.1 LpqB family beta-propeller domain-containing protein [Streptomyces gobiensis]
MKADRRGAGALLATGALLLTGCASMPSGGEVKRVDPPQRAEADSQVRVFGVSPQKGEQPRQIVRGFLEATTSDEANFDTARQYLTEEEGKRWDPFARTTVVSGGPDVPPAGVRADSDGDAYSVEVTGEQIAEVDGKNAYAPGESAYLERFRLIRVDGEWRISQLPDGLVLGESDFQRIYRSVNTYYFANLGPEASAVPGGRNVLVADPVYLRRRIDPVTETVKALLNGPTDWLKPVASSAFPSGVRLAPGQQRLSFDDSGTLTTRLTLPGKGERPRVDKRQCDRMAAQLLHTVDHQSSTRVNGVTLADQDGGKLCQQSRDEAQTYAPGLLNGQAAKQYFVDGSRRLVALSEDQDVAVPVEGPFGKGALELRSVAVSRDEVTGAGVSLDGRSLYVAPLSIDVPFDASVLTSQGKKADDRLTAPSWDGLGDLWVADRDPDRSRLLRLRDGEEKPETVAVPGLGSGRIEALRVAADGVRIALLIQDGERTTLQLGRIERANSPKGEPTATVTDLRPVAPQLENVVAASWAGGSRLVVVGKESGGVQQLRVMSTDGSAGVPPTLPGVNNVKGIAASEDEDKPLLADSEEGIVRLPRDANWQEVTDTGSAPVYPG